MRAEISSIETNGRPLWNEEGRLQGFVRVSDEEAQEEGFLFAGRDSG